MRFIINQYAGYPLSVGDPVYDSADELVGVVVAEVGSDE